MHSLGPHPLSKPGKKVNQPKTVTTPFSPPNPMPSLITSAATEYRHTIAFQQHVYHTNHLLLTSLPPLVPVSQAPTPFISDKPQVTDVRKQANLPADLFSISSPDSIPQAHPVLCSRTPVTAFTVPLLPSPADPTDLPLLTSMPQSMVYPSPQIQPASAANPQAMAARKRGRLPADLLFPIFPPKTQSPNLIPSFAAEHLWQPWQTQWPLLPGQQVGWWQTHTSPPVLILSVSCPAQ